MRVFNRDRFEIKLYSSKIKLYSLVMAAVCCSLFAVRYSTFVRIEFLFCRVYYPAILCQNENGECKRNSRARGWPQAGGLAACCSKRIKAPSTFFADRVRRVASRRWKIILSSANEWKIRAQTITSINRGNYTVIKREKKPTTRE